MLLQAYLVTSLPLFKYLLGINAFTKFNFINTFLCILIKNPKFIYFTLCCSIAIFLSLHSYWIFDKNGLNGCIKWAPQSNKKIFFIGHFITHILPVIILLNLNTLHYKNNVTLQLTITAIMYHFVWAIYINKSMNLNKVYELDSDNTVWLLSWGMALVGHIIYYAFLPCEN